MNDIVSCEKELPEIKTWNGQRVVTFKDIDIVHGNKEGTAKRGFNRNKKHFIEGEEYFFLTNNQMGQNVSFETSIPPRGLTVLTKSGYLLLAKTFTDDLSWTVQKRLVNSYFESQENQTPTVPVAIPTCALAKNKQKTWSEKNLWKFQKICKDMDWELKYLYHKILLELNDMYNMDFYKNDYHNKHHTPPKYNMDLINEYFELQQMADKYLEYLMNTFGETLV